MKKVLTILLLTCSTLLVVGLNLIPHHHHGGMICVTWGCEQHNELNDPLYADHANHSTGHTDDCQLELLKEFLTSGETESKQTLTSELPNLFPVFTATLNDTQIWLCASTTGRIIHYEHVAPTLAPSAPHAYGLRAPPTA